MHVKEKIKFPDLLSKWPFPRTLTPHPDVAAESDEWIQSFKAFPTQEEMNAFKCCNFALLSSLFFPFLKKDAFRSACDMVNLIFVFDEFSDVATDATAQYLAHIMKDALRNPHKPRPEDEHVLGEVTHQFQAKALECASMTYQKHNIVLWDFYIDSVVQEAKDRNAGLIRDLASFIPLRRGTVGVYVAILMTTLDSEIPPQVYEHPTMQRMLDLISDIVLLENDMYSFQKEDAAEEYHNLFSVVMKEYNFTTLQEAFDWSAGKLEEYTDEFLKLSNEHFWTDPALDETVKNSIYAIANIVTGSHWWSFESVRYFGKKHEGVSKSRTLELKGIKTKVISWSTIE